MCRRAVARSTALYGYGAEKCRVLTLFRRSVIDLEGEFRCPIPSKTALEGIVCLMPCHGVPSMECAFRRASVLS